MAYYTSVGMPQQMSGTVRPSGSGTYIAEKNSGQPVNMFTQMPMCNLVPVLPVHQMGSYPPHLTAGGWQQSIIRLGPPPQMMGSQPLVTTVTYQAVNYGSTVPLEQMRPPSRERPDLMTAFTERAKKRGITIEPQQQIRQQPISRSYSDGQQSSCSLENTTTCPLSDSIGSPYRGSSSHRSIISPELNPQFYVYRDPTKSDSDVSLSISDSDVDIGPNVIVRQSLSSGNNRVSNKPPPGFPELGTSNNNNNDYNLSLAVAHLNATQHLDDGFMVTSCSDTSIDNSVVRSVQSSASDVDVTAGRRSVASSNSSHNSRNSRKGIPPPQLKHRMKMSLVDAGRTPPPVQRVVKDDAAVGERGLVSPVSDEMLESEFLTPTSHASSWATPRSAGTPVAGGDLAPDELASDACQFSPRYRQVRTRCCDVGCQTPAVVTVNVGVGNLVPHCVDASTNTDAPALATADVAVGSDTVDDYAADQNVPNDSPSMKHQNECSAGVSVAAENDLRQINYVHRRSNSSGRNSIISGISGKSKMYADGEVIASVSATTDNLSCSPSVSNAHTSTSLNSSLLGPTSPPAAPSLPVSRPNDILFRIDETGTGALHGVDRVVVEPLVTASTSASSLAARQMSPRDLSRPSSRLECDTESLCVIPNCPFQHSRRIPTMGTEHHETTPLTGVEHREMTQPSEPEPAQRSVTDNTMSDSSYSPQVPPGLEHIKDLLLSDTVGALPLPRTQQTSSIAAENSDLDDYIYYSDEEDDNIYVTTSRIADTAAAAANVIAALQADRATPPAEVQVEVVASAAVTPAHDGQSSAVSISLSNPPPMSPPVVDTAAAAAAVPLPSDHLLPDEVLLVVRIMQEMLMVNPSLAAIPTLMLENEAVRMVLATRQQRLLNQQAASSALLQQQQQQLLFQEQLLQQQQQMLQQQVVDDPVDLQDDRSSLSGIGLPSPGSAMVPEYIATTDTHLLSDHSDELSAPELPAYFRTGVDSPEQYANANHPDSRTSSDHPATTRFKFHTHHNFDDSCSVVSAAESHVSRQAGRGRGRGVKNNNEDIVTGPPPLSFGEPRVSGSGGRGRGSRQLGKDPPPAAKPPTPLIPPLVPPGPSQSRSNSRRIQRQVAPSNEAWDDEIDESAPQLFTVDSSFFKTGVIKK